MKRILFFKTYLSLTLIVVMGFAGIGYIKTLPVELVSYALGLKLTYMLLSLLLFFVGYVVKTNRQTSWVSFFSKLETQAFDEEKRKEIVNTFFRSFGGTTILLVFYYLVSIVLGVPTVADVAMFVSGIFLAEGLSIVSVKRISIVE